jgi:hypothetical protein
MTRDEINKINSIETNMNDVENFIQMFRDGEYDDPREFWYDVSLALGESTNIALSSI